VDVYIGATAKKAIAGAIDWPGWVRAARDEASALDALAACGPRYALLLEGTGLGFAAPHGITDLTVVERLPGNATTDFGAPGVSLAADARPVNESDLVSLRLLLTALWQGFDAAAMAAAGKELRKGPRGGGRDLDLMIGHVLGADASYLGRLARKAPRPAGADGLRLTRAAILAGLDAAARGEVPERGPRGGAIWSPRRFVRTVAYHVVDHTWELEDRII
jgi:hypothetical protein